MTLLLALLLAAPAPAKDPQPPPPAEQVAPAVPDGFRLMEVATVLPTGDGMVVLLADRSQSVLVPIAIGAQEALTILLRHERQEFVRPLTHDLLDKLVDQLGGEVTGVRVDALRDGIFVATVTARVRATGRTFEVDSRSSDAIAIALGHRLPIFVAETVVTATGLDPGLLGEATAPGPVVPDGAY